MQKAMLVAGIDLGSFHNTSALALDSGHLLAHTSIHSSGPETDFWLWVDTQLAVVYRETFLPHSCRLDEIHIREKIGSTL